MKRVWAAGLMILALATFALAEEPAITLFAPPDKTITATEEIEVQGAVARAGRSRLEINGKVQPLSSNGKFSTAVKLAVGKNKVTLRLVENGKVRAAQSVRVLRLKTFTDLKEDHWSKLPVEYFATLGLTHGMTDQSFAPTDDLTRAQLTKLIANQTPAKDVAANLPSFSDVSTDHWASEAIRDAAAKGLVVGYPDGTFAPDNSITRIEAVAAIVRFTGLKVVKDDAAHYSDLKPGYWGEAYADTARRAGYLTYIKTDIFGPEDTVSRGEAIALLAATKYGQERIKELLDFSKGY